MFVQPVTHSIPASKKLLIPVAELIALISVLVAPRISSPYSALQNFQSVPFGFQAAFFVLYKNLAIATCGFGAIAAFSS